MKNLHIVKIGGHIIDDKDALDNFLDAYSQLEGGKLLVHGGGKLASSWSKKLGLPVNMHKGRRITDASAIELITMVYAGLNKQITAQLQARGCTALGLSGADLNCIPANKRVHPNIDFGFVGDLSLETLNVELLVKLIEQMVVPVFCALSHDGNGQLLNTNADTIAATLAKAFSSYFHCQLWYCFEKKGVLTDIADEESWLSTLNKKDFDEMVKNEKIHDGMYPKLENAFSALNEGVQEVALKHADNLLDANGTYLKK
ncbi:acetylglutamate kinase [Xanthovirga aplysinae]|uniref:acetylglutamate kinase n=1 Tax=Xanthovirga aplysinae TaxID=2529853 RepID=UPI0012BCCB61|nr:acetylglutamate kinase [Xanthovirga aplysinae]MTI32737.1 acetylglutamate kinase [Xanthovirga aplysinae]